LLDVLLHPAGDEVGQRNYLFFFGFTSRLAADRLRSCVSWLYAFMDRKIMLLSILSSLFDSLQVEYTQMPMVGGSWWFGLAFETTPYTWPSWDAKHVNHH